jgi:hypothetical protein
MHKGIVSERPMSTATDATLIALGERFEKLLLEHMDAWLTWAPRMRAARAEVEGNTASLAVAIQRTGCDVVQAHMSELERDMQPLAEEIIAAPATSLGGLRAKALVALWAMVTKSIFIATACSTARSAGLPWERTSSSPRRWARKDRRRAP